MTRYDAIKELNEIKGIFKDPTAEAITTAIKCLEAIDKINDDILVLENDISFDGRNADFWDGIDHVKEIIDKHLPEVIE